MTNPDTSKPPGQADVRTVGSTDALPVAPALGLSLDAAQMPRKSTLVTHRILLISVLAIALGALAAWAAQLLMFMINVITDVAFYGRVSDVIGPTAREGSFVLSPAGNQLGAWVILIPAIGGLLAGIMARWGSRAIQGHGIPEAMEQILTNESNIPARMTWLKPVSSAFAIGTGGPFGAEGPIISTGGALGSLLGQLLHVTANERKVLLAAGAAAGMAAVFGAPVASLVLAVELLLFELRPRSLIPVALATVTAVGIRYATYGAAPVFPMPNVAEPGGMALISFVLIGAVVGFASVWVTKAVYGVEDLFAKFESASSSDRKWAIAQQICNELKIHSMIEEEIFYPACEGAVEEDLYKEAFVEHDGAKVLINDIMETGGEGEFFEAKVKVLSEEIEHHVKEEEKPSEGFFAQARQGDIDMVALRDQLMARKEELMAQAENGGLPPAQLTAVDAETA